MSARHNLPHEPGSASPPVVLVVEDDILQRAAAASYLRESGFDVVEASDACEAIRVMQAQMRIDVVFSDINMPGDIDGLGLARWVRRERPELKVILTSGLVRTTDYGLVLVKPYDYAALGRQVRAVLAH